MPRLSAIGVIRVDDPNEYYSKEYGDQLFLTSAKSIKSNGNESEISEAASTSSVIDSGWNRIQNRIEQISSTLSKSIPSKFHSRKSSEESHGNSTSSGFSSAQHSPQGSSSLVAYENFLIVDDDFNGSREQPIGRRVISTSSRCTGVLRLNNEIPDVESCRSPSQINCQFDTSHSAPSTSRAQQPSSKLSFWERMRMVTSAITLRQQPFQPFTPSPSGSLLPNTAPPNTATIAAISQQRLKQRRTTEELYEERRQRIRRYVYMGQGALILIVALLWLASNFVDLKAPNRSKQSNQSSDTSGLLSATFSPFDHAVTVDTMTQRTPSKMLLGNVGRTVASLKPHGDINSNSTKFLKPNDIDNEINGNRIDEGGEMTTPDTLWNTHTPEMHRPDEFRMQLPHPKVAMSDTHKIRKRWKYVSKFLQTK